MSCVSKSHLKCIFIFIIYIQLDTIGYSKHNVNSNKHQLPITIIMNKMNNYVTNDFQNYQFGFTLALRLQQVLEEFGNIMPHKLPCAHRNLSIFWLIMVSVNHIDLLDNYKGRNAELHITLFFLEKGKHKSVHTDNNYFSCFKISKYLKSTLGNWDKIISCFSTLL